MKKRRILIATLLAMTSCMRPGGPFFKPLEPVTHQLSNGMEVFCIEDHEFPTAQLFLYIRGGSVYDPKEKEGLASIAMQTIRLGGVGGDKPRSPDSVEQTLEFVGASLEMGSSAEYYSASLTLMKKDLGTGLDLLFDLLRKPALDSGRFQIVKVKAQEGLAREKEDPLMLGYREYPRMVYGEDNPWGRRPAPKSVRQITREDVKKFHRESIHPDRMILAASGDFSAQELVSEIEKRTGDWRSSGAELIPPTPVEERFERGVSLVARKGLTQTTILSGHLGARRENPDKFPILVMNFVLGGGGALSSRLGDTIRTSAGKAYAVWSDYGFGKDYGLFRAVAQTASENTGWVVLKMHQMIREMNENPNFTDEEIHRAKQAILTSLIFDFETRFSQVKEQAKFHLWSYPPNYLEIFQREIAKVSKSDLERVAKRYLHPDGLKTLLISDPEKIQKDLSSLSGLSPSGRVETKEIE